MLMLVSGIFALALALSLFSIGATLVQKMDRIEAVLASGGEPTVRTIRLGATRPTGRKLTLVENGSFAIAPWQGSRTLHDAALAA